MSRWYNCVSMADSPGSYEQRSLYKETKGEIKGGCFDCPGKDIDKFSNYGCENCARLGKGKSDCWDPTNYRERPEPLVTPNSYNKLTVCEMPDCERMAKGRYCYTCQSRRTNRKGQWKRLGKEGQAPEWFLNRPVDKRGPAKKKGVKDNSIDKTCRHMWE